MVCHHCPERRARRRWPLVSRNTIHAQRCMVSRYLQTIPYIFDIQPATNRETQIRALVDDDELPCDEPRVRLVDELLGVTRFVLNPGADEPESQPRWPVLR